MPGGERSALHLELGWGLGLGHRHDGRVGCPVAILPRVLADSAGRAQAVHAAVAAGGGHEVVLGPQRLPRAAHLARAGQALCLGVRSGGHGMVSAAWACCEECIERAAPLGRRPGTHDGEDCGRAAGRAAPAAPDGRAVAACGERGTHELLQRAAASPPPLPQLPAAAAAHCCSPPRPLLRGCRCCPLLPPPAVARRRRPLLLEVALGKARLHVHELSCLPLALALTVRAGRAEQSEQAGSGVAQAPKQRVVPAGVGVDGRPEWARQGQLGTAASHQSAAPSRLLAEHGAARYGRNKKRCLHQGSWHARTSPVAAPCRLPAPSC